MFSQEISLILFLLLPFLTYSDNSKSGNVRIAPNSSSIIISNNLPLIIAHRGDSARMPENTIPAFELALSENVDFIEPDLVLTKDKVLVCHHDLTLASKTDIRSHPEFAHLRIVERNITYDNLNYTISDDWLVSDFTLSELKKLRIVWKNETWSIPIPTFDEFMDTVGKLSWKRVSAGKHAPIIGIMPELKHPSYFNALSKTPYFMENLFLKKLEEYKNLVESDGDDENESKCGRCEYKPTKCIIPCIPLIIQCWEPSTIIYLHEANRSLRLLTLLWLNNAEYLTWGGMQKLAGKTEFVGLDKEFLRIGAKAAIENANVSYNHDEIERLGGFIPPNRMVDYVEQLGMKVGLYTMGTSMTKRELESFFRMGVNAFFVEGLQNSLLLRDEYFSRKDVCFDYDLIGEGNYL